MNHSSEHSSAAGRADPAPPASGADPILPAWLVPALLIGMVGLWSGLLAATHRAPDLDGMEELVWASSFEWGYLKHPPLPSWLLYPLTWVFGKPVWLPFLAAQSLTALALYLIWRLGCEWVSPARSLIAVLALSTCAYFSMRGSIYNHNTVQLWSVAGATWLYYRALTHGKLLDWAGLGLLTGIAFLTKYSVVVQLAAFALFALVQGQWRKAVFWQGAALAVAIFVLIISPHLMWLAANDFAPLRYYNSRAVEQTGSALREALNFLLNQLGRNSPMLLVWGALACWNRRTGNVAPSPTCGRGLPVKLQHSAIAQPPKERYVHRLNAWDKSFLLWVGLAPLGLTVLVALATDTHLLASSWATTFFILYGFFIFWWLSGDVAVNLKRSLTLVITLHVLLALGYSLARGPLAFHTGRASRPTFPGPPLAAHLLQTWQTHVPDAPLRLVASDTWLGGNIAVNVSAQTGIQTQVFIYADYAWSPWLDPARALDCGVLVAYSRELESPAQALVRLREQAPWQGVVQQRWSSSSSRLLNVEWGILPPTPQCALQGSR